MSMQPLGGTPYTPGEMWNTGVRPSGGPAAPRGPMDRLESTRPGAEPLMPAHMPRTRSVVPESPRPWPPTPSRSSALVNLGSPANLGAAVRSAGTLGPACAELLQHPAARQMLEGEQPGIEGQSPSADGWKVSRNPNRTPLQPRDPFEIPSDLAEVGPLQVMPSCWGRIQALRLQWPEEFLDPAYAAQKAVLHDLLSQMAPEVRFEIVAEGLGAPELKRVLEQWRELAPPGRVRVHELHIRPSNDRLIHPMTMWARDGALLLTTAEDQPVLLLPRSFRGDGQVDPSVNRLVIQGSAAAPALLHQTLPEVLVRRSSLYFEGGDVVASRRCALIGADTLRHNMQQLKLDREAVLAAFAQELGVAIQVVEPQPDFHIDLGFTFLDDDTVAVAHPAETLARVGNRADLAPMVKATRDKQLPELYERAAQGLSAVGYRVVRLPNLAGVGLSTPYFSYNNVLLENYADQRKVYMPVYEVPELDEWARQVYRQHGFQVLDMPSARWSTQLWGAIRCATGELRVLK